MKVFYLNTVCGKGSTGNIVTALMDRVRRDGGRVLAAYGVGGGNKVAPGEALPTVSAAGYYLHNLRSRLTGREGRYSRRATRALVEKIRSFDPDIIHLHNLHGHYVNYEVLFSYLKTAGKPVVWTLHDCWPMTGQCTHFDAVGCEKWQTGCFGCSQLRQYPQCYGPGDVKGNYTRKKAAFTGVPNMTLVTPSHWMGRMAKASFLGAYPLQVIHTGIDLTVFRPRESDFREKYRCKDTFLLLGVAFGWTQRKGLDVFLDLASRLGPEFTVVLVGTDEAAERQLPTNIISIPRTQNQQELAEIYTAADLLVNPTREEALGLVNLEALACGTPVVTFRTGGSPECVDESCGCVVDRDDTDELCRQILRIARERPYTSADCIRRASAFRAEDRFGEYLALYKSVLED